MPIDPRQQDLWNRVLAHRFDDPAARLTFTGRLARENGWTIGRAVRVVNEYRRFVFLALTAGHPVTPSEDVDQVWHLHLAYTRDYWQTFCGDVLGEPLHHGPTRGGAVEAGRYDHQYRQTLAAYAAVFDAVPPADIWPRPEQRFGPDLAWRRVNLARHWVIPKPRWFRGSVRRATSVAGAAAVPLVAVGIPNPLDLTGPSFLALFAALATGSIVAGVVLRRMVQPEGESLLPGEDLEPLELALLADDGRLRCTAAGLAVLAVARHLPAAIDRQREPPEFSLVASPPAGSPPVLRALHARLAALGKGTLPEAVKAAVAVARDEFEPPLVARGLLVGPWWTSAAPWMILLPAAATLAIGISKIAVGVSRGKPVGFLVFGCLALAVIGLLGLARKPRRTRRGDAVMDEARERFRESGQREDWLDGKRDSASVLPLAVALLGTATLSGTGHAYLEPTLNRHRFGGGDGGGGGCSSSGDGGCSSSGGGGCGGCGGCGGD
jgi:uncharacterized protein (TIGR04222 family)